MTRLAVVHPTTLLAKELRERLDARPMSWHEVQLFSPDSEEAGTLTEIAGGAAVVQSIDPRDPEPFSGIDIAFFCGPIEDTRPLIAKLAPETKAVVLSTGAGLEDGAPEIPSLGLGGRANSATAGRAQRALSPPPGAIFIAHLAAPLLGLGLRAVSATLIEPASTRNEPALHELFEQAKRLLTFASQEEAPTLGGQWAFNLGRLSAEDDANVRAHLEKLLGPSPAVSVHLLHAGVFHGLSGSLALDFAEPVSTSDVKAAWGGNPAIESVDDGGLGPVDAAQSEMVLVGSPRIDAAQPKRIWVWATMDNLTRGGAINALEIAESMLAS